MSKKFKAGDLVYFPDKGTQIFRLDLIKSTSIIEFYPLCIYFNDNVNDYEAFTNEGRSYLGLDPTIFHATPENHACQAD